MALLKTNFAEVPDKYIPVGAGIYTFKNIGVKIEAAKPETLLKDPNATNLVVEHEIETDGDMKGRKMTRTISTKMATEIKRLAMSSGLDKGQIEKDGIDTDLLVGRSCRGVVKPNTYRDATTGAMRENTQLAEYLIPGDAGYNT